MRPFSTLNRWYRSWAAIACWSRGLARYDLLREELLVLNIWAIFCWVLFCVVIGKNSLTEHYRIATTINNHHLQVKKELLYWHNYEEEEEGKAVQDEDWGGDLCHSEGWRDI